MKLKGVLFDLGGTLIQTTEIPLIFKRILGMYGVEANSDQIMKAHDANQREFDVAAGLVEMGYSFWRKWNLKLLNRLGINNNVEFLAGKIDELFWDCADLQFYPDVKETLAQLESKQVKLGIVTNGVKRDYDQILQKLGAEHYFDIVVGIDTCKKAKPDGEIFLYAVDRLDLNPSQVLFVGDSIERDYEGALKAGLKPLLIDRRGRDIRDIDSINDLSRVLDYF